jgi:hypothetical protein
MVGFPPVRGAGRRLKATPQSTRRAGVRRGGAFEALALRLNSIPQ